MALLEKILLFFLKINLIYFIFIIIIIFGFIHLVKKINNENFIVELTNIYTYKSKKDKNKIVKDNPNLRMERGRII